MRIGSPKLPDVDSVSGTFLALFKTWGKVLRFSKFLETRRRTLNGERLDALTSAQRSEIGVMAAFPFALYAGFLATVPAQLFITISTWIWDRPVPPNTPPSWVPLDAAALFADMAPTVESRLRPFIVTVLILLQGWTSAWQLIGFRPRTEEWRHARDYYWYVDGSYWSKWWIVFVVALGFLFGLPLTEERAAREGSEITALDVLVLIVLYVCWSAFWMSSRASGEFMTPRLREAAGLPEVPLPKEARRGVVINVVSTVAAAAVLFYGFSALTMLIAGVLAVARGWMKQVVG